MVEVEKVILIIRTTSSLKDQKTTKRFLKLVYVFQQE